MLQSIGLGRESNKNNNIRGTSINRARGARAAAKQLAINSRRMGYLDLAGAPPMMVDEGLPPPPPPLSARVLQVIGGGGSNSSARRRARAAANGSWHPIARVKNAIAAYLPSNYSSQYTHHYNFGPGRPSGTKIATKIKWRKLLGDVFSINGMAKLRYTKGQFKVYSSPKAQKSAVMRRAGLKSYRYYKKNGY